MLSEPDSFNPTLVFPIDEMSKAERLKMKLEKILSTFQKELSEPNFSEHAITDKTRESFKEGEIESRNPTIFEMIDSLKTDIFLN